MERKQRKSNLLLTAVGIVVIGCCLCSCSGGSQANVPVTETLSQKIKQPHTTPTLTMVEPQVFSTITPTLTPTIEPPPTPASTTTEASLAITNIQGAECIPNQPVQTGKVVDIVDGDTIKVLIEGQVYSVRYIGMDTPENTTTREFFGPEATSKNAELVFGKDVTLIKDVSETDQYGRLVRYVLLDDMFVNLELVELGFANAYPYPPDNFL